MAIYRCNHTNIGRTTHDAGTAGAHARYVLRRSACTDIVAKHTPAAAPGQHGAVRAWLDAEEAADRINARVIDKINLALPIELNAEQNRAAVSDFCERLTKGQVPYLAAIHAGPKDAHNPHAHVIVRDRHYETGKRVIGTSSKGSTDKIRLLWETVANEHLERAGRPERIDHRSLEDQAEAARQAGDHEKAAVLDRKPTIHIGPAPLRMEARGEKPVSKAKPEGARVIDYPKIDKGRSRSAYNAEIIDLNQRREALQMEPPPPSPPVQKVTTTQTTQPKPAPTVDPAKVAQERKRKVKRYWQLVDEIEEDDTPAPMTDDAKLAIAEKVIEDAKWRQTRDAQSALDTAKAALARHDERHQPRTALAGFWRAAKGLLVQDPAKAQRLLLARHVADAEAAKAKVRDGWKEGGHLRLNAERDGIRAAEAEAAKIEKRREDLSAKKAEARALYAEVGQDIEVTKPARQMAKDLATLKATYADDEKRHLAMKNTRKLLSGWGDDHADAVIRLEPDERTRSKLEKVHEWAQREAAFADPARRAEMQRQAGLEDNGPVYGMRP